MIKRFKDSERGFSFIELSVATAVFSIGLGSLSLMMLAAVQGTAEARHRTVATSQADSMAEIIAMSADAYGHYVYPPEGEAVSCDGDLCQSDAMAAGNLLYWQHHLREELPGGGGMVCRDSTPDDGTLGDPSCDGNGSVVIKVFWEESRQKDTVQGEFRRVVSRLPW